MPKISTKNQITIPVAAHDEARLRAGEAVSVEPAGDGELRVRRAALTFDERRSGSCRHGHLSMRPPASSTPLVSSR